MNFYKFQSGDRIRILEAKERHQHTIYDVRKEEPVIYCSGPNCALCKAIEHFKTPWYKRLWNRVKSILK